MKPIREQMIKIAKIKFKSQHPLVYRLTNKKFHISCRKADKKEFSNYKITFFNNENKEIFECKVNAIDLFFNLVTRGKKDEHKS